MGLLNALTELEKQMTAHLHGDDDGIASVVSILAYASGLVRDLAETLKGREKAAIDARERLRLEAIVHRIALELDTVMRLTELLSASAASVRVTVRDIHIKVDNCVGASSLRSYAILTSSNTDDDDIVAYYGVTKVF